MSSRKAQVNVGPTKKKLFDSFLPNVSLIYSRVIVPLQLAFDQSCYNVTYSGERLTRPLYLNGAPPVLFPVCASPPSVRAFFLSRWVPPRENPEGPRPPTGPSGDEDDGFPSSPPAGLWPSFGHSGEGAGAPNAPHAALEVPSKTGKPELASERSDGWFDTHGGTRASGPSTSVEVSESPAVTEDCDYYDEPVTLAYGFGAGGGQASVECTASQGPTGDTAASHVELRPPPRQSPGSPSSRCSLDGAASPLAPWKASLSTRSLAPLSASDLSSALRPLAAGRAPPEAGCYISMLPDELDPHLSEVDVAVAIGGMPPVVGGGSTGEATMRRCLSSPGFTGASLCEPARTLPANSSGRFRLTRTRSSRVLPHDAVPRAAGAEPSSGGGPTAGRPGPLRAPSFSVDLGAPHRREGVCVLFGRL